MLYDSVTIQVRWGYEYSWDSTGFGWTRTNIVKNSVRFTGISLEILHERLELVTNQLRIRRMHVRIRYEKNEFVTILENSWDFLPR